MFRKELAFLSNFYEAPFEINGVKYKTVEHYFQSEKATGSKDKEKIIIAKTPADAKRLGKQIELRSDWDEVKDQVMFDGILNKFLQNKDIAEKLIKLEGEIVEYNKWHDNYWGFCLCKRCQRKKKLNKVGKILMEVRNLLKLQREW